MFFQKLGMTLLIIATIVFLYKIADVILRSKEMRKEHLEETVYEQKNSINSLSSTLENSKNKISKLEEGKEKDQAELKKRAEYIGKLKNNIASRDETIKNLKGSLEKTTEEKNELIGRNGEILENALLEKKSYLEEAALERSRLTREKNELIAEKNELIAEIREYVERIEQEKKLKARVARQNEEIKKLKDEIETLETSMDQYLNDEVMDFKKVGKKGFRNAMVLKLRKKHFTVPEIAEMTGVSTSTIYRIFNDIEDQHQLELDFPTVSEDRQKKAKEARKKKSIDELSEDEFFNVDDYEIPF